MRRVPDGLDGFRNFLRVVIIVECYKLVDADLCSPDAFFPIQFSTTKTVVASYGLIYVYRRLSDALKQHGKGDRLFRCECPVLQPVGYSCARPYDERRVKMFWRHFESGKQYDPATQMWTRSGFDRYPTEPGTYGTKALLLVEELEILPRAKTGITSDFITINLSVETVV